MRPTFTKFAATAVVVLGSGLLAATGAPAQSAPTIIGTVQVGGSTTTSSPSTTTKPPVKCGDAKNHGEYVSSQKKGRRSVAAKSDCGKPNVTTTTTTRPTVTTALGGAAVTTSTRPKHDEHDDDHEGDDHGNEGKSKSDSKRSDSKGRDSKGRENEKGKSGKH